jgi:HEAT repeat protein
LRDALRLPTQRPNPVLEAFGFSSLSRREEQVERRARAVTGLKDLRQALALKEWTSDFDMRIRADVIAKRFRAFLDRAIRSRSATTRLAAARFIGEVGTDITALEPASTAGFGRRLAPELIELIQNRRETPEVRVTAIRSLGKINPRPDDALKVLGPFLKSGQDVRLQRAAAAALDELLREVAQLRRKSFKPAGVVASEKEVREAAEKVLPVAARGFGNPDPAVRRLCASAAREAAMAVRGLIPSPNPESRKKGYSREEIDTIRRKLPDFDLPAREFARQVPRLQRLLSDANAGVRLVATQALSETAHFWNDLHTVRTIAATQTVASPRDQDFADLGPSGERLAGVTVKRNRSGELILVARKEADPPKVPTKDPLGDALQQALAKVRLTDPDVNNRLAAVDFLELLEARAAKAAPAVIDRIARDPNKFVRWAAVRTLGRIGPVLPKTAVPALARRLADEDRDVRLETGATLQLYGPRAKPALPAVIRAAARTTDPDFHVALLRSIRLMGKKALGKDLGKALDALGNSLNDSEPRVRLTAAEILGEFGRDARTPAIVRALRKAMRDDDAQVRKAASEALLNIELTE